MITRLPLIRSLRSTINLVLLLSLATTVAGAADYTARIGHLESPQQSRHQALEQVAQRVAERTGGAVEFQLFPQGRLGNQEQMIKGVHNGTLEATISPAALLVGVNPVVSILDIFFLLPSAEDAAQAIRAGEFGTALLASFASRGLKAIALWPNGWKHFTSNKPLPGLAAFTGQRFRVVTSSAVLDSQFEALGAHNALLSLAELYQALQVGVLDGQESTLATLQQMKLYEVQDYLVLSNHGVMDDVVLFNPLWWENLPGTYQIIIQEEFQQVIPELHEYNAATTAAALLESRAAGMEIREMSAAEKAQFRNLTYPVARAAYLEQAGSEGLALIRIYEKLTGLPTLGIFKDGFENSAP